MRAWILGAGLFALLAAACTEAPAPIVPLEAWRPTEAQLLAISRDPDVAAWHRDVVLRCPRPESIAEVESAEIRRACEVAILEGTTLRPTPITNAFAAERLAGRAVLVVERDGTLTSRREDGTLVRRLDGAVTEAHASEDGMHVVYVRDVPGTSAASGDLETEVAVVEIVTGAIARVAVDPSAIHPRLVPGTTDEVVYVSRRSGHESLWRAAATGSPVQLTNVDVGSVPWGRRYELLDRVPGSDAVWLGGDGDPTLLYWAELYGEPHAYVVHLDGEPPYRLGRGYLARQLDDGTLAAIEPSAGGAPRVRRFAEAR